MNVIAPMSESPASRRSFQHTILPCDGRGSPAKFVIAQWCLSPANLRTLCGERLCFVTGGAYENNAAELSMILVGFCLHFREKCDIIIDT